MTRSDHGLLYLRPITLPCLLAWAALVASVLGLLQCDGALQ